MQELEPRDQNVRLIDYEKNIKITDKNFAFTFNNYSNQASVDNISIGCLEETASMISGRIFFDDFSNYVEGFIMPKEYDSKKYLQTVKAKSLMAWKFVNTENVPIKAFYMKINSACRSKEYKQLLDKKVSWLLLVDGNLHTFQFDQNLTAKIEVCSPKTVSLQVTNKKMYVDLLYQMKSGKGSYYSTKT